MIDLSWLQYVGAGGIFLALVTALVGVLRYQNKQITDGTLIPASTHVRELTTAVTRGDEWKNAALKAQDATQAEKAAHDITSAQLSKALDGNQIVNHFFETYLPPRGTVATAQAPEGGVAQ